LFLLKAGLFINHAGIYVLEMLHKRLQTGHKYMFNTAMVKLIKDGNRIVG
jgi:hypothetical protein